VHGWAPDVLRMISDASSSNTISDGAAGGLHGGYTAAAGHAL